MKVPLLITALTATLACGDSTPGPGAGGPPGTLEGPDVILAATTEHVYTVGAYMGEDWESFGSIADVAFDGEGNAHILDMQEDRVVVLDPNGTFVRFVGGPGEGPGELRSPSGLNVLRDGGYVVSGVASIEVFAPGGEHLRRMPLQVAIIPGRDSRTFSDGSLVATVFRFDIERLRQGLPQLDPPGRPIEIFPIEHGKPEVLYTAWDLPDPEGDRRRARRSSSSDGVSRMSAGRAFEPRLHFDVISDDRLAVVDSIGYRVKLVARDGSVVATVERPIAPLPVTEAMKEAARERYRAREVPSNVGIFRIERESVDELRFADEIPVIANMAVDWDGRIWVERTGADGVEPGPIDIVTPEGGYVGTLPADGIRIPSAFGPDGLMAYTEADEVGIPTVRVIRLVSLQPQGM